MTMSHPSKQFFLSFDTVRDFDRACERRGTETGFFFGVDRNLAVGEKVSILVSVKGIRTPVALEGRVLWRRIRDGGPDMPPGLFVGLVDRDRARLDSIVRFLQSSGKHKERRDHFRFPVHLEARYQTAKGSFPSETRNISRKGAFLRCMGPLLTVGASFPVTLFLDDDDTKGTQLSARVAWIDYFEDTQGMGVEFDGGQSQLRKINRLCDRLERELKKHKSDSFPG